MSLRDIVVPTETFQVGDVTVTVRGIGASDLGYILEKHRSSLSTIGTSLSEAHQSGSAPTEIMIRMAKELPDVAFTVVACGAGDRNAEDVVRVLPFPLVVQMLNTIGRLTFAQYGGLQGFIGQVISMARASTEAINELNK